MSMFCVHTHRVRFLSFFLRVRLHIIRNAFLPLISNTYCSHIYIYILHTRQPLLLLLQLVYVR